MIRGICLKSHLKVVTSDHLELLTYIASSNLCFQFDFYEQQQNLTVYLFIFFLHNSNKNLRRKKATKKQTHPNFGWNHYVLWIITKHQWDGKGITICLLGWMFDFIPIYLILMLLLLMSIWEVSNFIFMFLMKGSPMNWIFGTKFLTE